MNLNPDFKLQIINMLPEQEGNQMLHSIESTEPAVSVRLNTQKNAIVPTGFESVPWCDTGIYLKERPQFTFDPRLHAGSYYVQDASSMFIYHVIKSLIKTPVSYLDLCAAPGGKTTAALQALPQGCFVVANEIIHQRAQILRENVIKWGADNCMVTCDSPRALGHLVNAFDVIAADVPCSGEGMFRKDDEAVEQWSPALVEQCAARQREILNDIWPALKPGGLLIYSTCTFNMHENEEMVDFIVGSLGASVIEVPILKEWNIHPAIDRDYPCYRFLPHQVRGEGLFMCVIRKNQDTIARDLSKPKSKKVTTKSNYASLGKWITGDYEIIEQNDTLIATPKNIKALLKPQGNNIHIIKDFGIELGTIKGKKIVPSHQLALSQNLASDAFPEIEVDYHTAIAYLRGEAITIDAPRGYVLIKYDNAILGFANNLGNRANNLYPKPWRIMSTHIPSSPPMIISQNKAD